MKTVPFLLEHLEAFNLSGDAVAAIRADTGPAKTIMDEGVPVGIFGILDAGGGAGWSWAAFTDALKARPVSLHRTTLREFKAAARGFKAVYGTVGKGMEVESRWLRRLGFEYERDFALPHGVFEIWALKRQS